MEKKQTAVEWLVEQLDKLEYEYDVIGIGILDFDKRKIEIENQAKQMEKEQIVESHHEGYYSFSHSGEQYYNETYGQTKN